MFYRLREVDIHLDIERLIKPRVEYRNLRLRFFFKIRILWISRSSKVTSGFVTSPDSTSGLSSQTPCRLPLATL